ncbi:hypothetical protein D3C72_1423020 [compost metagenome]
MAVVVVDANADEAQCRVARHRLGGVTRQNVDFTRLQGSESGLGGEGNHLELGGVTEHRCGDCAAGVNVDTLPDALAVREGKAGEIGRDAALDVTALFDGVERLTGQGGAGHEHPANDAQ